MNPDLQAQTEVIAKSYVPEAAVPTYTDPKEIEQREHAKQVRAKLEANPDNPLAALLASEDIGDLSGIDIDSEVERRIGAPAPGEEDRREKAKKAAHEAQIIAEKGLDGIEASRQGEIINEYIAKVIDVRGDAFRNLSLAQKQAIARSELSRQEVREKVAELLKSGLSPTAEVGSEDDRSLAIKMQEKGQKQSEANGLSQEFDRRIDERERLIQELADYQPEDATTGAAEGEKYRLMQQAKARINAGRAAELTRELVVLFGRDRERLTAEKVSVRQRAKDGEILVDETELKLDELARLEEAQREYDQRRARRESLPQEIQRLTAEMQALNTRMQAITLETAILDLDINPLAQKKKAREQTTLLGISRIVTQAANIVLNADVRKRDEIYRGILTEKARETEDKDNATLYDALGSRWEVMATIDGQKTLVTNTLMLNSNWKFAIASGGDVSTQVEILLTDQIRKAIKSNTPAAERTRILDDAARIRDRLKTDPVFAEKATSDYLTHLISRRLATGEPISIAEQTILEKYGWTEHIAQAVEQRVHDDETLKTRIERIIGATGVEQNKLEVLRKKYPSQWATIIALLLAGVAVPDISSGKSWFDRLTRR